VENGAFTRKKKVVFERGMHSATEVGADARGERVVARREARSGIRGEVFVVGIGVGIGDRDKDRGGERREIEGRAYGRPAPFDASVGVIPRVRRNWSGFGRRTSMNEWDGGSASEI